MGLRPSLRRLSGWTPVELNWDGPRPKVRWCFTEGVDFTDPFFRQTIATCQREPFRLLFWRETDLETLGEFAWARPGLELAGLIFHLSRCGSTLVAQMLASLDSALVMSEPDPIDMVLRAPTAMSEPDVAGDWLRWMMSALGQRRRTPQERFVVKLDAWALFQLPLIRRAFPDTPCVFVYRDPIEVLVSHLGHRGYHMVPGALPLAWLGLSPREQCSLSPEAYCASVLAGLCRAAIPSARDGYLRLINYESLPESVVEVVAPLFGFEMGPSERTGFASVAERNAKNPALPFVADSGEKQRSATPATLAAVAERVNSLYQALESIRLGRS